MFEIQNGIEERYVEVPPLASVGDKILILNIWLRQLQSEGWNIISTKPYNDNAFILEVRRID